MSIRQMPCAVNTKIVKLERNYSSITFSGASGQRFNLSAASVCKALAAVDRTVTAGLEGNLALCTALGANGIIHDALGTGRHSLAGSTTGSAALGLVLKSALCIEFLLAGREHEFLATIFAN